MKKTYIALLRGINVGGNNIVKMADLKKLFEDAQCENVQTYIQSGNVVCTSTQKKDELRDLLWNKLNKKYGLSAPLFILTKKEWETIVSDAPKQFGKEPEAYRYDVLVCDETLRPKDALQEITLREGIDTASAGTHALYFRRLTAKAGTSYLSKVTGLKIYQHMTIRNWNTTMKLRDMLGD